MAIHQPQPPEGEPGSLSPPIEPGWILVVLGLAVVALAIIWGGL